MEKLKYIRIQQGDNQYNGDIPIGVDCKNVDLKNGNNLQETIGDYNYKQQGTFKERFDSIQEISLKYTIKSPTKDIEV